MLEDDEEDDEDDDEHDDVENTMGDFEILLHVILVSDLRRLIILARLDYIK